LVFYGLAIKVGGFCKSLDRFSNHKPRELQATQTVVLPLESTQQFQCEGKVYCSEMSSYDEALFYLNNCPGTKMDGDHDGDPCERHSW
jgi:hypothetical protein